MAINYRFSSMDASATIVRVRQGCKQGLIAFAGCVAAAALAAPVVQAEFGLSDFSASTTLAGEASRQAGAHPNLRVRLAFNRAAGGESVEGNPKDVSVALPPGLVANPTAPPTCPLVKLISLTALAKSDCLSQAVVGYGSTDVGNLIVGSPIFNMARSGSETGVFGMNVLGAAIFIKPQVRPGDHGISALSARTSQGDVVFSMDLEIWGEPADPSHDAQRGGPAPVPYAFLTAPTSCGSPTSFTALVNSWQQPEAFSSRSVDSDLGGRPFVFSGCDQLDFAPTVAVQPGSHRAGSPTGLDVSIELPQTNQIKSLATAALKRTSVTLPEGMSVSPAVAAGLGSCAPAQIGLGSPAAPTCPSSSNLGTARIDTPLLDRPLVGDVILARQNDNPSRSLLALYLVVKGPDFYLKLPGQVSLDPVSGQVTLILDNAPQLPFEELHLDLRGGPNAPLLNPSACGAYTTRTELISWASTHAVARQTPMVINEGCAGSGFDPALQAGAADPVAGESSSFTLRVTLGDSEQNLSKVAATLPPGELAKLAGVPVCGEIRVVTGDCPAASQVGVVAAAFGAGLHPLFVPQPGGHSAVYLAGPYRGAPYSFLLEVPAVAGAFDLGTVLTRVAIRIDPITARVRIETDPLLQSLQGIPLAYRDARIVLDRPGFMLNPTSCRPSAVDGVITSAAGRTADRSPRFQASSCDALGFEPKVSIRFFGPTHRGSHPKLRTILSPRKGDANLKHVAITLPGSELLDNTHIRGVCSREEYAAASCPAAAVVGHVKAWTPVLDHPLAGPIYMRASSHRLPDLAASLRGQVHLDLSGRVDSVGGRLRTTFDAMPDVPLTRLALTMRGGGRGLIVNTPRLCVGSRRATARFLAQNGKVEDREPIVKTECPPSDGGG